MKTANQRVELILNDEDLSRIKHLQAQLHLHQKADLVKLALLKLEESLIKEKTSTKGIIQELYGFTKGSKLTSEAFSQMKAEEIALEKI